MREVGDVHLLGDFRLGPLGYVQDARLALDQRPLETLFAAVDVDALSTVSYTHLTLPTIYSV